jgi:hypothetical protein
MMPMSPEQDGMHLNPDILIQTQNNFIAQARIKEVQMEAAIQQLRMENYQLRQELASHDEPVVQEGDEGPELEEESA